MDDRDKLIAQMHDTYSLVDSLPPAVARRVSEQFGPPKRIRTKALKLWAFMGAALHRRTCRRVAVVRAPVEEPFELVEIQTTGTLQGARE